MSHYKHWEVKVDAEQIVWLGFGRENASVNTIGSHVLDELNSILQDIAGLVTAKGLILYSLKDKGFIAGADIHEFAHFNDPKQVIDFLRKGQTVFSRLESLTIPTVALIHGFCMGGGLELALACDYRLATDDKDTRLGLPEVLLGIHPGWGGTVRLPRLIGGFQALSQLILTGAPIAANKAKQLGLLDDVVPIRQLKRAGVYFIQHKPPRYKPTFSQSLTNFTWVRRLLAKLLRREVGKKFPQNHYPAPYAVIDLWEKEGGFDERAYLKEADSVEQLITQGETAKNLVRAYLLREQMKAFAKQGAVQVHHVHVIGAGVMGGDIAAWCALRGLHVTLQDKSYEQIAPAIARAHRLYTKKLRKPRLIQAVMDHLIPDPQGDGVKRADVIIEAVFENLEVKQSIVQQVEDQAKPEAIIATNTSSIPLDEINQVMTNPQRLVGIHFFNPVAQMELVEVVSGSKTSQEIAQHACAFVGQIGKLPLPVKSSPGFLINRILMPYLIEAVKLLEEGYSPEVIDDAAKSYGMMMGPVELADTVGMDVCLAVADNLTTHLGGQVPEKLRSMVEAGKLGRKTGQGFYRYVHGKPVKHHLGRDKKHPELAERMIKRMVDEANACLREEVVQNADLLDGGMIFATGFAPFRGGPLHDAKSMSKHQNHSAAK